jgi:SAM-dependent methyltransferase
MAVDRTEPAYEASRRIYSLPRTIRFYAGRDFLLDAERSILADYAEELRAKAILDLGMGCGRTTKYLLQLTRDYVGLDYAPAMSAYCRSRFPGVAFRCGDASNLAPFGNASFDVVVFSFNGLDHAPPARRLRILGEIRRVLRPGGLFIFSAHNLLAPRGSPWIPRGSSRARNPVRFVALNCRRVLEYVQGLSHYRRNRHREESGEGYAMVVDQLDQYRHMMYYITPAAQFVQLARAGFGEVRAYAEDGSRIRPDAGCRDRWIYYVARRAATEGLISTQPL